MSAAKFLLEHFYYGQLVHHGQPTGADRLLAYSAGMSTDLAALAVERAPVPPMPGLSAGTWAIIRTRERQLPFLMAQSQIGAAGERIAHYVVFPSDALRAIGGNLSALLPLAVDRLPVFEQLGDRLPPVEVAAPPPLTNARQIDDILDLMTAARNRFDAIESLLAAIVQGVQLAVIGAPVDLRQRVSFVEGLLALLPPSARFGVTFITHSEPGLDLNTQIRFYADGTPPAAIPNAVVFDWGAGTLGGESVSDDYSRFVTSLLRLDADMVIRRTAALTGIAGWRIQQGDRLADALAYASQRVKVDEALRNAQPVSKDEASRILAEDPTLPADLRDLYAAHLIKFSLAMRDMTHADAVAAVLRTSPELENAVATQINSALTEGHAALIYPSLMRWLAAPQGLPDGQWITLTHKAALLHLRALLNERDLDGVVSLLSGLQSDSAAAIMRPIIPRVIEGASSLAGQDRRVAEQLFLLGLRYLPDEEFMAQIVRRGIVEHLPVGARRFTAHLSGELTGAAPGLLGEAARSFADEDEALMLLRLGEIAARRGRADLIDADAMKALASLAIEARTPGAQKATAQKATDPRAVLAVTREVPESALAALGPEGGFWLLQIRLALGEYEDLARQMIRQSAVLYPGDRQIHYLRMMNRLFAETPIPDGDTLRALSVIQRVGIRSAPLAMACIGALEREGSGSPELDSVAGLATDILLGERTLLEVIPSRAPLVLLTYYTRRKDATNTIRASSLIPLAASYHKGGLKMMSQMYARMTDDDRTRVAALQMLRAYVQESNETEARRAVAYFGRELGERVQRALETSYTIKRLMGGTGLVVFADRLHKAADLLWAMAEHYADPKITPSISGIMNGLGSLPGALIPADRRLLAADLLKTGRTVVLAGRAYRAQRGRDEDRHITQLLTGEADPKTMLDVLWVMGGYFARGSRLDSRPRQPSSPYPLQGFSSSTLKEAASISAALLDDALRTLPPKKTVSLTAADVRAEIESLWSAVPEATQRAIARDLAQDLQRLADLCALIEANGDSKAMADGGLAKRLDSGRLRPRSALEMIRLIHGYYLSRS